MRMFLALRLSVVFVLTLLQLLVPLVHAHVHAPDAPNGLHIPGLELYRHTATPATQLIALPSVSADGLMVMVDSGIKPSRTLLKLSAGQPNLLLQDYPAWPVALALSLHFPHYPPRANTAPYCLHAPRAPPLALFAYLRISA